MPEYLANAVVPEVHQAEGMLAERLGMSVDDAAAHLRARAERAGRSLEDMAQDVIHGRAWRSDPNIAGSC